MYSPWGSAKVKGFLVLLNKEAETFGIHLLKIRSINIGYPPKYLLHPTLFYNLT